jgi:hypothetical protein
MHYSIHRAKAVKQDETGNRIRGARASRTLKNGILPAALKSAPAARILALWLLRFAPARRPQAFPALHLEN